LENQPFEERCHQHAQNTAWQMKSKIQFINQANNKVKEIIIQNTRQE